jgi:hypothetical protein
VDYLEYDYFHQKFDEILALLRGLSQKGDAMSAELDRLKAAVQNCTTVGDSLVTLVKGLAAEIAANKNDPAAVQAISDELNTKTAAWKAAVETNPPQPAPGPAPTPPVPPPAPPDSGAQK